MSPKYKFTKFPQKNITVHVDETKKCKQNIKNKLFPQEENKKLIIAIVLSLGVANTASAGTFKDFFKTKEISKSYLNTVIKNHLIVAEVKHPGGGLQLFDACFNGQNYVSKTNAMTSFCTERIWTVDEDDKGDVSPQDQVLTDAEWEAQGRSGRFGAFYTPSCVKFGQKPAKASKDRLVSKAVNCRWVAGRNLPSTHPQYNEEGESGTLYNICDHTKVPGTFPRKQTIRVHKLNENFASKVYFNHAAHEDDRIPGPQKFYYTIPMCDGLTDRDIPDTKKN